MLNKEKKLNEALRKLTPDSYLLARLFNRKKISLEELEMLGGIIKKRNENLV